MERRDIGYEVKTLARIIDKKIDAYVAELSGGELSGMKGWILNYLFMHRETPVFQRDIEAAFYIRRPTATEFLQGLEESGYIRRVAVSYDARLKKIELTEKAENFNDLIKNEISAFERRLSDGFSESELDRFENYIARLPKISAKNSDSCRARR